MVSTDLLLRYNYDEFIPEKYTVWMNFDASPPLGDIAPDFKLWQLEDRAETSLHDMLAANRYTIVEWGSFT